MIVSHERKFIFLKTRKTAGTSLEIALSKYCGPRDVLAPINFDEDMRRQVSGRGKQNHARPVWKLRPGQLYRYLRRGEEVEVFAEHMTGVAARRLLGAEGLGRILQVHHRPEPVRPDPEPVLLVDKGAVGPPGALAHRNPRSVPALQGRVRERELADLHPG
jgi:hypothetical protein